MKSARVSLTAKIKKILPAYIRKSQPRKVAVIEISERGSQKVNQRYLGKNGSANVLSFCYGPDYGEILVCPQVIRREAKAQGNSYQYQMTWMTLHGMLHLAGMHHERSEKEARKVELLEEKILKQFFYR